MSPTLELPATRAKSDLAWLSWLKVVAIFGVIAIHVLGYNAAEPDARETLRGTVAIYLRVGFVFVVPIFVMASGATLLDPAKYAGAGSFLRRRASRLVPPLIFWHLWYVVVKIITGTGLDFGRTVAAIMNGELYTGLYFFWIVLGLAIVTPLLMPFVREASRFQLIIAGAALAALPALSLATLKLRGTGLITVDTAWTWWIPYLGLYLLGWGLRDVHVVGWRVLALLALVLGLGVLQCAVWRDPDAVVINLISPPDYYGAITIVYTIAIYVLIQSLIRRDGPLSILATGGIAAGMRTLSDATLGVFGLHLTILLILQRTLYAGSKALPGTGLMLSQLVLVTVITYALVLVLRKVPLFRSVL